MSQFYCCFSTVLATLCVVVLEDKQLCLGDALHMASIKIALDSDGFYFLFLCEHTCMNHHHQGKANYDTYECVQVAHFLCCVAQ